MATQAQIHANRRNAQRSTGPTTGSGKAVASRNSITHGLWAKDGVIAGEDPAKFESFQSNLLAELAPHGVRQQMIAERIVHLWWKIRRIAGLERAAVNQLIAQRSEQDGPADALEVMTIDLMAPRSVIRTLHSQEMRLATALRTAQKELRELQAAEEDEDTEDLYEEMYDDLCRNEPNSAASAVPAKVSVKPPPAVPIPSRPPHVARALANAVSTALTGLSPSVA